MLASEKEERELIDRSADQERMELRGLELWINSIETDRERERWIESD